jgi:hypothetical protein
MRIKQLLVFLYLDPTSTEVLLKRTILLNQSKITHMLGLSMRKETMVMSMIRLSLQIPRFHFPLRRKSCSKFVHLQLPVQKELVDTGELLKKLECPTFRPVYIQANDQVRSAIAETWGEGIRSFSLTFIWEHNNTMYGLPPPPLFQVDIAMDIWLQHFTQRLRRELFTYLILERNGMTICGKKLDQCGPMCMTTS